jgi:alpha-beta hydrolase superfamily lysophospholipase
MIFFPDKLPASYKFQFSVTFSERNFRMEDGITLHGLIFQVKNPKGLIFYLHGNAGALDSWGMIAQTYTGLGYDLFILDYRGYGKSEGNIGSEAQFYQDLQTVYREIAKEYPEERTVIIGNSLGTGPAAMLASMNHPRMLILQAPYYSIADLANKLYPYLPKWGLKYSFKTYEFIKKTSAPVFIFHGDRDEIVYYGSSLKLLPFLKPADKLFTLKGQGHNGINENKEYYDTLKSLLDK